MRYWPMKSFIFSVLVVLLFGCEPVPIVSRDEKLRLYNDVLDQMIADNYFQHCIIFDEKSEKSLNDFYQGKIDTLTYSKLSDSLKAVRKSTLPKCVLNYTNEFQIFTKGHELNDDIKFSISEALKDTFLVNNFNGVLAKTIVDTLSQTGQLSANDLAVSYLEIIPHVKKKNRPYGEGMGVMGLSRIYFNKNGDKAILFYEFNCGPKCGTGEVVFIIKTGEKWKVEKYKRVWDS